MVWPTPNGARPEEILEQKLVMNSLPVVGMYTTACLDAIITDSGRPPERRPGHRARKTNSGVISMDAEGKTAFETIAEGARRMGKIGGAHQHHADHPCHTGHLWRPCLQPEQRDRNRPNNIWIRDLKYIWAAD